MVQMGKFNKNLKGIFKRWHSLGRNSLRSYGNLCSDPYVNASAEEEGGGEEEVQDMKMDADFSESIAENERPSGLVHADNISEEAPPGFKTVYVGKTGRKYFISSEYLEHPLIRALTVKNGSPRASALSLACEAVFFEHLVWMLETGDVSGSLNEIAQFYSYD